MKFIIKNKPDPKEDEEPVGVSLEVEHGHVNLYANGQLIAWINSAGIIQVLRNKNLPIGFKNAHDF